ncbi:MAG: hypothetical protein ACTSRS_08405 [Candidatus Helarchaeota archaeon]
MGVLGIIIQTEFGLPIHFEFFGKQLEEIFTGTIDMSLTAGFITAINMFTKQYGMKFGHIKLHQSDKDIYGINMIATKLGEFLILCFVEPYVYHDIVREKLGWIYERVLKKYEPTIKSGKVPTLTDEEKVYIGDIMQDLYIRALIANNKEMIDQLLGQLTMKYIGIYGISINSFDNSILYFSGIAEETFKLILNNLGRRSSIIKEYETIDSYISFPDYQPVRVYALNPGIKLQIQNVLTNLPEKTVDLYYYIIADPGMGVNLFISDLMEALNPIFIQ